VRAEVPANAAIFRWSGARFRRLRARAARTTLEGMSIDITFRGMESSEFVVARAREHAIHLMELAPEIVGCRVVIEAPTPHHNHGQPFHVRLHLQVPGNDIVVDREPLRGAQAHEDVYVALNDAFHGARRQLEERSRKRREETRRTGNGATTP
jgi:ribosome-associated translation inhibitor RaiA